MDSVIATILILGTPAAAILGGIVASVLKTRGQHRLIELAQRERMAAIEKGLDVGPLVLPGSEPLTPRQAALRRAQGLMIGGLLTLALGIGLTLMLMFMPAHETNGTWPVGIVPICLGIALLHAARLVRKDAAAE